MACLNRRSDSICDDITKVGDQKTIAISICQQWIRDLMGRREDSALEKVKNEKGVCRLIPNSPESGVYRTQTLALESTK